MAEHPDYKYRPRRRKQHQQQQQQQQQSQQQQQHPHHRPQQLQQPKHQDSAVLQHNIKKSQSPTPSSDPISTDPQSVLHTAHNIPSTNPNNSSVSSLHTPDSSPDNSFCFDAKTPSDANRNGICVPSISNELPTPPDISPVTSGKPLQNGPDDRTPVHRLISMFQRAPSFPDTFQTLKNIVSSYNPEESSDLTSEEEQMDSSYRLTAAADESARTSKKFSENFDSQRESHSDIKQESDCENQFCRSKSETYDGSSLQGSHQAAITIRSNYNPNTDEVASNSPSNCLSGSTFSNYCGRAIVSCTQSGVYTEPYGSHCFPYPHSFNVQAQYHPSNGMVNQDEFIDVDRTEFDRYLSGQPSDCIPRNLQGALSNGNHYASGFALSQGYQPFYSHQEFAPCPVQDTDISFQESHLNARQRPYSQDQVPYPCYRSPDVEFTPSEYPNNSDIRGELRSNGTVPPREDGDCNNGQTSTYSVEDSDGGQGNTLLSALADIRHMYYEN
ncbi:UNVERIFIED_CONTAM: hypothetical protein RMT77_002391 [Armadillidium vulgare]